MILIRPDGKILMEERDENTKNYPLYWNLPSGGSEENETPEETACRELREELDGYEAPSLTLLFTSFQKRPDGKKIMRYVYLVGYDPEQQIRKGNEGRRLEFVDPKDFPGMQIFSDHLNFINRAQEMLTKKNVERMP